MASGGKPRVNLLVDKKGPGSSRTRGLPWRVLQDWGRRAGRRGVRYSPAARPAAPWVGESASADERPQGRQDDDDGDQHEELAGDRHQDSQGERAADHDTGRRGTVPTHTIQLRNLLEYTPLG